MHRTTPLGSAFRSWVSGGARTVVTSIDDKSQMQSMGGNFMKGEERKKVEAPQNYGFTSVVHDAEKDKDGKVTGSAEGFVQFMGGNRTFPVCSVMDDRRHRLKELDAGDVAMFRGKDDQLQLHLTSDGGFWTGRNDKKLRMALVEKEQDQQQQPGVASMDTGGGGGGGTGGAGGGQQQKKKGQTQQRKKDSSQFFEINGDMTQHMNKRHQMMLDDKEVGVEIHNNKNVYLGKLKDKGSFLRVMLEDGSIAKNTYALIGGTMEREEGPVYRLIQQVEELTARVAALEARLADA
jgi:phage gp45-like